MSMTAAVDGLISLKVRNTGRVFYFLMSLHPLHTGIQRGAKAMWHAYALTHTHTF